MDINDSYIKEVFDNTKLTEFEQLRNKVSGLYLKGIDKENLKIEIE